MAQHQPIRKNTPPSGPSEIPDKLYFRIGEVSRLCDVPAYVLRFWESEFPQLKPHKGGTGQRLYRRRDVETVLHIKSLLYDEGYTIPGARQVIKVEHRQKTSQLPLIDTSSSAPATPQLRRLKKDLRDLLAHLSNPPARTVQTIRAPRAGSSASRPGPAPRQQPTERLFDSPVGHDTPQD